MISTEKAFDMLPYAVDIWDKLNIKQFAKDNAPSIKGKTKEEIIELQKETGEKLIKYVAKNSGKIKSEVLEIVALVQDKTVDDVKAQNLSTTLDAFLEIFRDKELIDFFKQAMP